MTGWLTVVAVAFTAQLAVLPGEKVQFIIAGLSTRYDPEVVVAAAGSAFAGWTAIEIAFGASLKGALPPALLDGVTAALFLTFAVLLVRSAPERGAAHAEPDGGIVDVEEIRVPVLGWDVPPYLGGFLPVFVLMVAGEFGDKTQLITISLAIQYGAHPGIWVGEMLAILPVSLLNAFFFHRFSHRFDVRKAHYAGAAVFLFFGLDTLLVLATGFSVWGSLVNAIAAGLVAAVPG